MVSDSYISQAMQKNPMSARIVIFSSPCKNHKNSEWFVWLEVFQGQFRKRSTCYVFHIRVTHNAGRTVTLVSRDVRVGQTLHGRQ